MDRKAEEWQSYRERFIKRDKGSETENRETIQRKVKKNKHDKEAERTAEERQ